MKHFPMLPGAPKKWKFRYNRHPDEDIKGLEYCLFMNIDETSLKRCEEPYLYNLHLRLSVF